MEGIDGAGKTTIAHRVESELRKKGHRVVLTTEPTRTWLGDAVKKSYDDDVGPLAETFLFLADRARHTVQIQEWLPQGAGPGSGPHPGADAAAHGRPPQGRRSFPRRPFRLRPAIRRRPRRGKTSSRIVRSGSMTAGALTAWLQRGGFRRR